MKRHTLRWRVIVGAVVSSMLMTLTGVAGFAGQATAAGPNLAAGKPTAASSTNAGYVSANVNDGNQSSYWESANNAFPQWAQVDLGSTQNISQVVLKLPTGWGARTETLSLQGSTDGSTYSTIVSSAGYTFDPNSSNTVTINFGAMNTRYVRVNITANTGWAAAQLSEFEVYGTTTSSGNLAQGKATAEGGHTQNYASANTVDGNQSTYWEGPANNWPANWLQVDLGATTAGLNKVVVQLPVASWGARTQTFAITGSTDGTNFSTIVASANYSFDPASNNTVTITFNATTQRYLRLSFTANSGATGGQVSEFQVFSSSTGDTQAPTAPSNLNGTTSGTTVNLSWTASTDNVGVTGYDIYANGSLLTSIGNVTTYQATGVATTATVNYTVKAHDAAGNQSGASNTWTHQGQSSDTTPPSTPSNLNGTTSGTTVTLTWNASTDNVGVTGYDVYVNGAFSKTVSSTSTTDTEATTASVSYYVKARDAAGNVSAASNTFTRTGQSGGGSCTTPTDQAHAKPTTSSSDTYTFVAANATDGDVTTYWEGAVPSWLDVNMGANVTASSVVVKLNPDPAWGTRTQTFSITGRDQASSTYTTIVSSATYTFTQGNNVVTIPVSAAFAEIRLNFTANSGAPGGQVAELNVNGCPAPNPDLTVSNVTHSPASPVETDAVTLGATVTNAGTAASAATTVNFYLGTTTVGSANVGALTAGSSTTVSANVGAQTAGSYTPTAKVDEANAIVETNENNNSASGSAFTVAPIQSADLVATTSWSPGNPSGGNTVTFTTVVKNQGNQPSSTSAHNVTVTVKDSTGATVKTLTGSASGAIAAGASGSIDDGTWTAANGKYTVTTTVSADSAEASVKQANNTSTAPFFVGRGANVPYDTYEAEAGTLSSGATVLTPNRTIGDPAGEASGRQAVALSASGQSVSFTTRSATNTIDVRFSIPDGTTSSLGVFNGSTQVGTVALTSAYAWLYGNETSPQNSGSGPRHIYDEANAVLSTTVPAGSTLSVRNTGGGTIDVDFIQLELATPKANPDPTHLLAVSGFDQNAIQTAISTASQSSTYTGIYLPAGVYTVSSKFQISQKPLEIAGAGMWYTRIEPPAGQSNTDIGFNPSGAAATGSSFRDFAVFDNYNNRQDGAGQVFPLTNVSNIT
ncbi:MAG: discoidin domain-containing protein, partial [Acidothermaceae bacterium]